MTSSQSADNSVTSEPIEFNPYFGGFILESLTIGMYGESKNAIREYIQNGFDSIQAAVHQKLLTRATGRIDVYMSNNKVTIRDNGLGIPSGIAARTLTAIGASTKDYREEAGFRGIGRLAGIAFSNRVTFKTKSHGEPKEATIVFDAAGMRADMSPSSGKPKTLKDLIQDHTKAFVAKSGNTSEHFFEVELEGFNGNVPAECLDPQLMINFLSQVAPVPYHVDFAFKEAIHKAAKDRRYNIDDVNIYVTVNDQPLKVFKPYEGTFNIGKDPALLTNIDFEDGTGWWGWIAHNKNVPAAFKEEKHKAIRVRVRNIQVGGTQLIGAVFSNLVEAPSYGRFNDWYIGEIFVDPTFLVPNARRDGFEHDENWRVMHKELETLCLKLGKQAYEKSKNSQLAYEKLAGEIQDIEALEKKISRDDQENVLNRVLEISSKITKQQRLVAKAIRNSDLELTARFRILENKLLDAKTKALSKLGNSGVHDIESVKREAQRSVVRLLMQAFSKELDPEGYADVVRIAEKTLGSKSFWQSPRPKG
jgi:hypothetical protein